MIIKLKINILKKIINIALNIYKIKFIKIMRETMMILFPFSVLGSIASIISISILSNTGFISNIFYLSKWIPYMSRIRSMFAAFSMLTNNIISVLAAYESSYLSDKMDNCESYVSGITSVLSFLIILLKPIQHQYYAQTFIKFTINKNLMDIRGIFIGILVGFITSKIFRIIKFRKHKTNFFSNVHKSYQNIVPVMTILFFSIVINQFIIELYRYRLTSIFFIHYQNLSSSKNDFLLTIIISLYSNLLAWFGLSGPYNRKSFIDDPLAVANLTFALKHHNSWNVPYKYTQTTLYHSFGSFGGVGNTLSLVIAIVIVAKTLRYHEVAQWTIFPVIFNINQPILLGIPVLFDPIYLIPFLITPFVNMLIASVIIYLHLMPPVTYPVPLDTPSFLIAFIGTGGSLFAFLVGIFVIIMDVILYIPFVKLSELIYLKLNNICDEKFL